MTLEKLKSGSYRASMMRDGKRYRITFDHKPSKREAEDALMEKISQESDKPHGALTFADALDKYVEMKSNVLSPNTVREYSLTKKRLSPWFTEMPIDEIDQIAINKQVNELSVGRSAKTVRNYHGIISAILGTFRPEMKIYTTLPQNRKSEPFIPSDEDVKRILEELRPTEYYVGTVLACMGMRRGEILALTPDDINGNVVLINKAMAIDSDRKKVIKYTKTTDSEREIIIPWEIADLIRKKGYVYIRKPGGISEKLSEVEKKLGIPHFSMHKLRHYFASKMMTITDVKTVMALCGWKTDHTPRSIYVHSMKAEQEKAKILAVQQLESTILK